MSKKTYLYVSWLGLSWVLGKGNEDINSVIELVSRSRQLDIEAVRAPAIECGT